MLVGHYEPYNSIFMPYIHVRSETRKPFSVVPISIPAMFLDRFSLYASKHNLQTYPAYCTFYHFPHSMRVLMVENI